MLKLNEQELDFSYIKSAGPGGQNVNKVATGVQLRLNVYNSSLPNEVRTRLILLLGKKLTTSGELIIKANRFRTQAQNKADALARLHALIEKAIPAPKKRHKTKPTPAAKEKRLTQKRLKAEHKVLRRKPPLD